MACAPVSRQVRTLAIMKESEIQDQIRLAVGRRDDVVLWRNNVGCQGGVRYGLCKGSSDLVGLLRGSGRFVALEVKAPNGKISDEQRMFLALIRQLGGVAAVVRSVEEAISAIDHAVQESQVAQG
jgi:hypothetical protein